MAEGAYPLLRRNRIQVLSPVIGQKLSHYSVVSKLGEGGMGAVYLAEDLKLKRSVALKILPAELAYDEERLVRFRREAESLAALDHPNIVTIFSIEQVGDLHILVMERVRGRGLDELLPEHGMPIDRLLDIAVSLSGALAAAHHKGITHRDLKPANLMLTDDGRLKVLDFGLAKLQPDAGSRASAWKSDPLVTREQTIVGTAPYMSPEQIEGRDVDGRSDVFCFGIVLYELATGTRPFDGESLPAVMSAILEKEPRPIHELRRDLPRCLVRILNRCLQKDPARRYQTASELQHELETLRTDSSSRSPWYPAGWSPAKRWLSAGALAAAVVLLAWQGIFHGAASDMGAPRIVVMPFANEGSSHDDYFAASMTDHIAGRLSSMAGLRVVPTRDARRHLDKTVVQIGDVLGVDYLLDGTVRWADAGSDRRVQIWPKLLRSDDGSLAWSQPYDRFIRVPDDISGIQREIARDVADRLGVTLTAAEGGPTEMRGTDDLRAYELYLQAQYFHEKRTEQDNEKALQCYRRAVEIDSDYALALCGMARVRSFDHWYCVRPPDEVFAASRPWLERALEADPTLPEVWALQAIGIMNRDLDFEAAETGFELSIRFGEEQLGGYATAHHWYGGALSAVGRHEEAMVQALRAQQLDPVSPIISTWVGLRHYFAGGYEQAIREMDKALFMDEDFAPGHWHRSWAYAQVGRHREAIDGASRAYSISPNPLYKTTVAWARALGGERDGARRMLDELHALAEERYVSRYHLATVHVVLDEHDRAFDLLEEAHALHDGWRQYLNVDPRLIPLRDDPRFADLVRRFGL